MRICCCVNHPEITVHLRGFRGASNIENLINVLDVLPTPKILQTAYQEMLGYTTLVHPPRLIFARGAFNKGGFFIPGLIVIGERDSDAITENLWNTASDELTYVISDLLAARGVRVPSVYEFLRISVRGRILAHELGHALIHAGFRKPYRDEEASADYVAGMLDAHRGRSLRLGELLFWSIGCLGPQCDHPPPRERQGAYRAGYASVVPQYAGYPNA